MTGWKRPAGQRLPGSGACSVPSDKRGQAAQRQPVERQRAGELARAEIEVELAAEGPAGEVPVSWSSDTCRPVIAAWPRMRERHAAEAVRRRAAPGSAAADRHRRCRSDSEPAISGAPGAMRETPFARQDVPAASPDTFSVAPSPKRPSISRASRPRPKPGSGSASKPELGEEGRCVGRLDPHAGEHAVHPLLAPDAGDAVDLARRPRCPRSVSRVSEARAAPRSAVSFSFSGPSEAARVDEQRRQRPGHDLAQQLGQRLDLPRVDGGLHPPALVADPPARPHRRAADVGDVERVDLHALAVHGEPQADAARADIGAGRLPDPHVPGVERQRHVEAAGRRRQRRDVGHLLDGQAIGGQLRLEAAARRGLGRGEAHRALDDWSGPASPACCGPRGRSA